MNAKSRCDECFAKVRWMLRQGEMNASPRCNECFIAGGWKTLKASPLSSRRSVIDEVASLVEERPADNRKSRKSTLKAFPNIIERRPLQGRFHHSLPIRRSYRPTAIERWPLCGHSPELNLTSRINNEKFVNQIKVNSLQAKRPKVERRKFVSKNKKFRKNSFPPPPSKLPYFPPILHFLVKNRFSRFFSG